MGTDRSRGCVEGRVDLTEVAVGRPAVGEDPMTNDRKRILYGRRRGRRLRPHRQKLIDELLPQLAIDAEQVPTNPAALFGRPVTALWLEVGFGGGEHLLAQATRHRDIGFIGCEPYISGVARLLSAVDSAPESAPVDNIRILNDDARLLIECLPPRVIGRVFVLFPDPWPKSRHHRRRFIAPPQLDHLARIMMPGAELRLASDHMEYIRWMLFHCGRHPAFEWRARTPADWRVRPADAPPTRYEEKALARGARCVYLRFRRRPCEASPIAAV